MKRSMLLKNILPRSTTVIVQLNETQLLKLEKKRGQRDEPGHMVVVPPVATPGGTQQAARARSEQVL